MTRSVAQRLADIRSACLAIMEYIGKSPDLDDLHFDAVRMRLVEIGEAAKFLPESVIVIDPTTPWRDISGMRDLLAHRYFDTTHALVLSTAHRDVPRLLNSVESLLRAIDDTPR